MPLTNDEILTVDECAAFLKVSKMTVYRRQREGVLPGYLVGTLLRFKKSEVLTSLPTAPVAPAHAYRQIQPGADPLVLMLKQRAKAYRVR